MSDSLFSFLQSYSIQLFHLLAQLVALIFCLYFLSKKFTPGVLLLLLGSILNLLGAIALLAFLFKANLESGLPERLWLVSAIQVVQIAATLVFHTGLVILLLRHLKLLRQSSEQSAA